MALCQNLVPLVNIKIAGKWMFIPLKIVLIGIDPYPYSHINHIRGWLWRNNHPVPVLHVSSRAWPEVRCMARHTVLKAPCPLVINGGEVIATCLWMFMDVGNFTKIG